ncbi:MAG: ATP-binding protein [Geobacteraceae bacterium]|nr:ATP-binding protein [Geobacteraceae bacterium]
MKKKIALEITIPNQTRYLGLIGKIGENMAREFDDTVCDRDVLASQLNIVLTESIVNAIKHANATDPNKEVHVRINVNDSEISIHVYDTGCGFDLNTIPSPCFDPGSLNEKGRGIYIIRSMMDSVEYRRTNGGNVLEMKKSLRHG